MEPLMPEQLDAVVTQGCDAGRTTSWRAVAQCCQRGQQKGQPDEGWPCGLRRQTSLTLLRLLDVLLRSLAWAATASVSAPVSEQVPKRRNNEARSCGPYETPTRFRLKE